MLSDIAHPDRKNRPFENLTKSPEGPDNESNLLGGVAVFVHLPSRSRGAGFTSVPDCRACFGARIRNSFRERP